jgi:hypothetical protein
MHQKNILIASHSLGEAITNCIITHKKNIASKITIVSLQELLFDYEIYDELSDTKNIIRWYKKGKLCISNTDHLLLNRVLYIPNTLFNHFSKSDKEYAQREFEAYIGFAFNSFAGIGNQSATGICGDHLSLPQQWHSIRKKLAIKVPHYYWGPRHKNSLPSKNNVIYSTIYNFLNWAPTNPVTADEHIFCFEKPRGEPVFILSIGKKQLITANTPLSADIKNNLQKIALKINQVLHYFISEILVFIDGKSFNFGCINHDIIKSQKNRAFNDFVCTNLINEFYRCVN